MTDKQIKNLILTGEGYNIEFKQSLDKSFIEEVCAFANASGGYILIGVSDEGKVTGVDTSNRSRSKIQDILNRLEPKLKAIVEIKKNLIVITVPEGEEKPYGCPKGFFIRIGANSQKMTRNEIIKFFKKEGHIRFEELVNKKAKFKEDFDSQAFKNFLRFAGISRTIKYESLLQNLSCLTEDKKMTNLGVLFFAKDIDFIMNYARVDCILFKGTERVRILNRKEYIGSLLDNIENALAFVKNHTNTEYVITGKPRREEIHDYPESALREAVINAVCHRDYFTEEAPVSVEVFEDRVQIRNPGGLPKGYDRKRFGTESIPRNLLIASMLHRVDYIEKAGTGISRIKQAIKNHNRKVKLKIEYGDNSLFYRITFKKARLAEKISKRLVINKKNISKINNLNDKAGNKKLVEKQKKHKEAYRDKLQDIFKINESEFRSIFGLNSDYFRIKFGLNPLNTAWLIYKDPNITALEIAEKLSVTARTAESYISQLKNNKMIKRLGSKKTGYWKVIKK